MCWRLFPASSARPSMPRSRRCTGCFRRRTPTTTPRTPTTRASSARACSTGSYARSSSSSGRRTPRRSPRTTSARGSAALESLRLVLGTQLDVTEESYGPFDPADPDAPRLALYHWLSWLQEEVVQALALDASASIATSRSDERADPDHCHPHDAACAIAASDPYADTVAPSACITWSRVTTSATAVRA